MKRQRNIFVFSLPLTSSTSSVFDNRVSRWGRMGVEEGDRWIGLTKAQHIGGVWEYISLEGRRLWKRRHRWARANQRSTFKTQQSVFEWIRGENAKFILRVWGETMRRRAVQTNVSTNTTISLRMNSRRNTTISLRLWGETQWDNEPCQQTYRPTQQSAFQWIRGENTTIVFFLCEC